MTGLVKYASAFFLVGVLCNEITASKENAIENQTRSAQYRYQPSSDEDDDFYDSYQEGRYRNPWFRNHHPRKPGYNDHPYRSSDDYSRDVVPFQRPKHHHHHHCHHSEFQPWEFYPENESDEVTHRPTTVKHRAVATSTTTTTTTTIIPQIDIRIGRKRRGILLS